MVRLSYRKNHSKTKVSLHLLFHVFYEIFTIAFFAALAVLTSILAHNGSIVVLHGLQVLIGACTPAVLIVPVAVATPATTSIEYENTLMRREYYCAYPKSRSSSSFCWFEISPIFLFLLLFDCIFL